MTESIPAIVLPAVRAELHAAHAVLADPQSSERSAACHIVTAWRGLYVAVEREDRPGDETLVQWVRGLARLPEDVRARAIAELEVLLRTVALDPWDPENTRPIATGPLLRHLSLVSRVLQDVETGAGLRVPIVRTTLTWVSRALLWGGAAVAILLLGFRPWERDNVGSWRGAYYDDDTFKGDPDIRRDADVAFDWGRKPPTDSVPADRFAARWDTCLHLDEDVDDAAFQLVSDDGSRLFIDGKKVVDNWGKHGKEAKGATVPLTAGVHHLRVEYFEERFDASIDFTASFEEEIPPAPIPARMLQYPGDEFDIESNPCGS